MYRRICDLVVARRGEAVWRCLCGLRMQVCPCGRTATLLTGGHWRLLWDVVDLTWPLGSVLVSSLGLCFAICSTQCMQPLSCTRLTLISVLSHQDPLQVTQEPGPVLQADPATDFCHCCTITVLAFALSQIEAGHEPFYFQLSPHSV